MQVESRDELARHQGLITAWFVGYRTGRSRNAAVPGLPVGLAWLEVARLCKDFMREHHKVICTIEEVFDTFDEYLANRGREKIPPEVRKHQHGYETLMHGQVSDLIS